MLQQSDNNLPIHTYKPFWSGNRGTLFFLALILTLGGVLMAGFVFVSNQVEGTELITPIFILGIIMAIVGIIGAVLLDGYSFRCPSCGQYWIVGRVESAALASHPIQFRCKHCGYEWIYEYSK